MARAGRILPQLEISDKTKSCVRAEAALVTVVCFGESPSEWIPNGFKIGRLLYILKFFW